MAFESSEHLDAFKRMIREIDSYKEFVVQILKQADPQQHFGVRLK
jgi:hypothetical protein